jgi:hypothetical protein
VGEGGIDGWKGMTSRGRKTVVIDHGHQNSPALAHELGNISVSRKEKSQEIAKELLHASTPS